MDGQGSHLGSPSSHRFPLDGEQDRRVKLFLYICRRALGAFLMSRLLGLAVLLSLFSLAVMGRPPAEVPHRAPPTDRVGDPLPSGALARMGTVRLRHVQPVLAMGFSPDGKVLASGGDDRVIRLWEPGTGRPLRRFPHDWTVKCLAFSPDGKTLAVSDYTMVVLLDAGKGTVRLQLRGHTPVVRTLAFSPDGKRLVSGGDDHVLILWDVATGKPIRRLTGHEGTVTSLAFSPDGKALASASVDKTVRLWDAASGKLLRTTRCFPPAPKVGEDYRAVGCLAFSPDSKALAVGTEGREPGEGTVRLLDAPTGKELRRLAGYARERTVSSVAFSPDGKTLAVGSGDTSLRLWEMSTGKQLHDLKENGVVALHFAPDGRTLASTSGSLDGRLRLWDVGTGKERPRPEGHDGQVDTLTFAPDGKALATLGLDNTIRVWEAGTGKQLRQRRWRHIDPEAIYDRTQCRSIAFLPGGRGLLWSPTGSSLDVWPCGTGGEVTRCYRAGRGEAVYSFVASPDGKWLALEIRKERKGPSLIRLWDREKGKAQGTFSFPGRGDEQKMIAGRIAFSPDGKTLAAVAHATVYVWDARSGKELRRVRGIGKYLSTLAFSPDGRLLAGGEGSFLEDQFRPRDEQPMRKAIRLWDVASGEEVLVIQGNEGPFTSLAFSPNGQTLGSANQAGQVRLWEVATGKELLRYSEDRCEVTAIAFSPSGDKLASSMSDGTALIWGLTPPEWEAPNERLRKVDLAVLWRDLGGEDAQKARRAIWSLAARAESLAFVAVHLRPVPTGKPEQMRRLIADLDHDDFDRRVLAARELTDLVEVAEHALRRELAKTKSAEVRLRIGAILKSLPGWPLKEGEVLRRVRAVAVLQRIGTPEARALLRKLAEGAPEARQTQAARLALACLAKAPTR